MPKTNPIQSLIMEIDRVQRTRKTMLKRLQREGEVIIKAKKYLRDLGIRPYKKKEVSSKKTGVSVH